MKLSTFYFLLLSLCSVLTFGQQPSTPAATIEKSLQQKDAMTKNSLVKNVAFKNIGPTVMSGRITDLAVNPENAIEFYAAYASGGLWHTKNNGTTFEPVLDNANTQNVGDIAVDWKSNTIWVGTGENNASRSSYAGIGILKSTDGGKTWQNMGLTDSHHIGRILINPNNPDEVTVGVTGHLYSPNSERGIYKTMDGGKTWQQTLFLDNLTGVIDMQNDPNNYDLMFASAWTKDRKAWNFEGSGNNSAIYKSTDAGNTWIRVSTEKSGLPIGEGVGRIGLAIYDANTVYAIHDNQFHRPADDKKESNDAMSKDEFKSMSVENFLKLEDKKLNSYLRMNGFQEKYRSENVKQMVRSGIVKPIDLAKYLEDANAQLFDTPVIGAEIYKSTDGGKSWKKTHDDYIDDLYYSYGYYFGHIYVAPNNPEHIYVYGVPILKSKDGGKTFTSINAPNVHADHHALWINPKNPNHIINGNDGGVNMTYDDGANWTLHNSTAVGQFYAIAVDNEKPYNVYGGLQDNGVWVGAHNAREDVGWHQSGQYPWESIMGGDGMQVQVDSRNSNIVYTGFQFGNYFRIDREKDQQTYIQPKHELGENPYRFNWQTPILLSSHNQDILYLGGNKLMRSMNQGTDWTAISDDLTNGGKKGNVAYGTLASISESPFQFGLLYTGSDDGLVYVTKDAGGSWENISATLPKDLWVSRIIASEHKKERVYVALNGYRWDDFTTYLYKSDDYGKTWKSIGNNIPASPVNVIRESPKNENILFVGTDNGAYVSFDMGNSWDVFSNGLTAVAVHDIAIQPEANDLLLGTHGRSIYLANIAGLQNLDGDKMNKAITLFDTKSVRFSPRWGDTFGSWSKPFEPSTTLEFYTKDSGKQTITILSDNNAELQTIQVAADKGFNYVNYDLTLTENGRKALLKQDSSLKIDPSKNGKFYLPKGTYTIQIEDQKTKLEIN
jgi:photosystem II stability/assembly factor-like uncharacterized protein